MTLLIIVESSFVWEINGSRFFVGHH